MCRERLIPLSQVDQYLGLAGRIRSGAGFDLFGGSSRRARPSGFLRRKRRQELSEPEPFDCRRTARRVVSGASRFAPRGCHMVAEGWGLSKKRHETAESLVPGEGFEPPTFGLQNRCTAAVLTRRPTAQFPLLRYRIIASRNAGWIQPL